MTVDSLWMILGTSLCTGSTPLANTGQTGGGEACAYGK